MTTLDEQGAHVVTISDTGVGLNEEEQVLALSRFGQIDNGLGRMREGTGLGLPISRGLVERHGGTLTIVSQKDVGTNLIVRFPVERSVGS